MGDPIQPGGIGHAGGLSGGIGLSIWRDEAVPLGLPGKGKDPRVPDAALEGKGEDPRKVRVTFKLPRVITPAPPPSGADELQSKAGWWQQTLTTALPDDASVLPPTVNPDASGFSLLIVMPGSSLGRVTGAVDSVISLADGGYMGEKLW